MRTLTLNPNPGTNSLYQGSDIRLDIAFIVSRLTKVNAGPSQGYLDLLKYLYRYFQGTVSLSLEFGGRDITINDLIF
jgi:hypothetical protein